MTRGLAVYSKKIKFAFIIGNRHSHLLNFGISTMAQYDIFISYRREGGYETAKHLYDLLTHDGYKVSFDIDTLRNGDFDTELLNRIDQCKDFVLVINQDCFVRTLDPSFNPQHDWLRQELAYALSKDKNIIPVFLNGIQSFPDGLPEDIAQVTKKNGPQYNRYYFNDFYKLLKDKFLTSKPRKFLKNRSILYSLSALAVIAVIFICLYIGASQKTSVSSVPAQVTEEYPGGFRESDMDYKDLHGNWSGGGYTYSQDYPFTMELEIKENGHIIGRTKYRDSFVWQPWRGAVKTGQIVIVAYPDENADFEMTMVFDYKLVDERLELTGFAEGPDGDRTDASAVLGKLAY